jgi:hypothetical protein
MAETKPPDFLTHLDEDVVARLPLAYAFARSAADFKSVEPMWAASDTHRERCHVLAPFYKPVSKPVPLAGKADE